MADDEGHGVPEAGSALSRSRDPGPAASHDAPPSAITLRRTFTLGRRAPETRRWRWDWRRPGQPGDEDPPAPSTYYEAFTGRPDPNRGFFVTGRRILNLLSWAVAVGIPTLLVAVGLVTAQSLETVFFMGLFGLIVGAMIRASRPRSPFD